MICNSLGSNFTTFSEASATLKISNNPKYKRELTTYLENKYQGSVEVLYKGREAIELALILAHLPKGGYVAINGYTCIALDQAITSQGYKVSYLDIEEGTLNFSASTLEKAVQGNANIAAVIIQNTLGFAADVPAIKQVCQAHKLLLIEDLAHSIGTIYSNGQEAGTIGDFVILSFSQDKVIDSVSGGALIIRNKQYLFPRHAIEIHSVPIITQLKDRFYPMLTWTIRTTYAAQIGRILQVLVSKLGLLSRPMDDLGQSLHTLPNWQCRLAFLALQKLPAILKHRQDIAMLYANNLPKQMLLTTTTKQISESSCLRFPIRLTDRRSVLKLLKKHGFYFADVWYDAPIAPAKYSHRTAYNHECPNAEKVAKSMCNLPTHSSINTQQAKQVVELLKLWQQ